MSEPSALSPNATWAMPVTTQRVGEPGEHGEHEHHAEGGKQLAAHHDTPRAVMSRSMALMPMNGATMPPRP